MYPYRDVAIHQLSAVAEAFNSGLSYQMRRVNAFVGAELVSTFVLCNDLERLLRDIIHANQPVRFRD